MRKRLDRQEMKKILGTKGKVSIDKYIQKKFLNVNGEVSGYITGIQLANMFGFTTQNPACYALQFLDLTSLFC